ncbi:hypothetical protein EXIGLDRAFT_758164 [Exidia glandulosa HHB12029]|uniref:Velvet domain-containing protein n=1 Tax=Exidia glandulosa HHB12029 TaxID=1314781 RepID=A0A165QN43_EXIGL|nr:hypothetical protein EXIGLDRAFT_758164 [Exidia glandulosa HHB12029]
MIQKTSARHISTQLTEHRPSQTQRQGHQQPRVDGPHSWGEWVDNHHYSLEVIQNPIRARMCGFGDKDRRPLAPAAVAKMIVRDQDNNLVDIDDIDVAFFVAAVDLWSPDGKREMNLVLHPSSADRYIPTQVSKPRRRPTLQVPAAPAQGTVQTAPSSFPLRPVAEAPIPPPQAGPGYPGFGFSEPFAFGQAAPFAWPYSSSTPMTAPDRPAGQYSSRDSWPDGTTTLRESGDVLPFRGWNSTEPGHAGQPADATMGTSVSHARDAVASSGWPNASMGPAGPSIASAVPMPMTLGSTGQRYPQDGYAMPPMAGADGTVVYGPLAHPQAAAPDPDVAAANNAAPSPDGMSAPVAASTYPRHTYTRTLVGPLTANAQRLLDEHRKPGVFFLFQDLSIRTEGSFRLRIRLMNVGAVPAPNRGATRMHTGVSPILAQTFTESFTVFSAKRFPGVPDTTALSIAFGNQGQKLPLRNRHGSSKQRGGRRRGDDDSDGESD